MRIRYINRYQPLIEFCWWIEMCVGDLAKNYLNDSVSLPEAKQAQYDEHQKVLRAIYQDVQKVYQPYASGLDVLFHNEGMDSCPPLRSFIYCYLDAEEKDWKKQLKNGAGGAAAAVSGGISSLSADVEGPLNALKGRVELGPSQLGYKQIKLNDIKGTAVFDGKPAGVPGLRQNENPFKAQRPPTSSVFISPAGQHPPTSAGHMPRTGGAAMPNNLPDTSPGEKGGEEHGE